MSDEARNTAILAEAYRRWSESRGASADYWISICDPNIHFGSIAETVASVDYMADYRSRDELGAYFAGIVPRTRSSHDFSASTVANFGFKRGTRIIELLVSFRFRSSLRGRFYEYFDTAQVAMAMA